MRNSDKLKLLKPNNAAFVECHSEWFLLNVTAPSSFARDIVCPAIKHVIKPDYYPCIFDETEAALITAPHMNINVHCVAFMIHFLRQRVVFSLISLVLGMVH